MPKNKLIKNVTIDELAVIINKGFDGQMDYLKKNFEIVNERFGTIDGKFGKVFNQLKTMDDKLDDVSSVKHRVNYIETALNIQPIKK